MTTILRKHHFDLPDGVIYLDGNSLGPLPRSAAERAAHTITQEWGLELIKAWNSAGWMDLPARIGDRVAALIKAQPGSVTMGDTLSIKVYQALDAALKLRPNRKVILSDSGNFPTDLYMAQGLIDTLAKGHVLRTPPPDDVQDAINDDVAVVMLTQVDYRTGRLHDMAAITARAHAAGAVMIWDLAHSAGAVPLDIAGCAPEFAVGCTYKFLNGGPGAPAFIHIRPDIAPLVNPALAGWMGHEAPFAMDPDYRPAPSTERMRVGTPPVVQLSILDAALDVWDGVTMADIRAASIALSDLFIAKVEAGCPALRLASPRDGAQRGSQVSFHFAHGYAAIQALIDRGVIGDFRAPDIMRFGITPLYLDEDDISAAADHICDVIQTEIWRDPKYQTRARVT
ncbi:kynureninase [Meridianimarinicoccus aquatilis]|uniref:Kynureninase n=1 Tax=Meridianimarinicoccus aquatilis TaxID=2552766 RepID=A0A4R6ASE1_9RHOB|nr:kynureninase [Fluviibacterium aquatile]TDL86897.1 kynureninase [Fluviibacterium aquatile]